MVRFRISLALWTDGRHAPKRARLRAPRCTAKAASARGAEHRAAATAPLTSIGAIVALGAALSLFPMFGTTSSAFACVVGMGTPATCTDATLDACLPGGGSFDGSVTFACGTSAVTIDISTGTGTKIISANTTIDGGNLITLSGGNAVRVFYVNPGVEFTVQNLAIVNGYMANSTGGGAIYSLTGAMLTVINSTFTGNSGGANGGAISNIGTMTVTNSTFAGNSANRGGAIYTTGSAALSTVTSTTFTGNSALGGGGIYNEGLGMLAVTNSTFTANIATNVLGNGGGGAIVNSGPLTVTNSTFFGNSSLLDGGAIYNWGLYSYYNGTLTVTNSTFSGNSASAGNANDGSSIYNYGSFATATLTNTILADSKGSGNCGGVGGRLTDGGHNIDDGSTCDFTGTGCASSTGTSFCNTNAVLDTAGLGSNGGPTQTIALCTGVDAPTSGCTGESPAINAGDASVCSKSTGPAPVNNVDQRGFLRPGTGAMSCSIGAFEANGGSCVANCSDGSDCLSSSQCIGGACDSSDHSCCGQTNDCNDATSCTTDSQCLSGTCAAGACAAGTPHLWVDVVGRRDLRTAGIFNIVYGNTGTEAAYFVPLLISFDRAASFRLLSSLAPSPQVSGFPPVDFSDLPISTTTADGSQTLIPLLLPVVPVGSSGVVSLQLSVPIGVQINLQASLNVPLIASPLELRDAPEATAILSAYPPNLTLSRDTSDNMSRLLGSAHENGHAAAFAMETTPSNCAIAYANLISDDAFAVATVAEPGLACAASAGTYEIGYMNAIYRNGGTTAGAARDPASMELVTFGTVNLLLGCAGIAFPPLLIVDGALQAYYASSDLPPGCRGLTHAVLNIVGVASHDPNAIAGPLGFGQGQWVTQGQALAYSIFFTNDVTATAPAQQVIVTDQLDAATVDLSAVSLGPIAFANQILIPPAGATSYVAEVDLRPAQTLVVNIDAQFDRSTGLLRWTFSSIDPTTGAPPSDPEVGFLPPDTNPPNGEGFVTFTVSPRADVPNGTILTSQGSVVFDQNAPIDTNVWTNRMFAPVRGGTAVVTPASLLLKGQTRAGEFARAVTIRNVDPQTTLFGVVGTAPSPFTLVGASADGLFMLPGGRTTGVHVELPRAEPGNHSGALSILTSDPGAPEVVIPLEGAVYPPGSLKIVPRSINFGSVPVGRSASRPVTVTNQTSGPVMISGVTTIGGLFSTDDGCVDTLAIGASCTETVTFAPQQPGQTRRAALLFTDDARRSPQKVHLSGAGM